MGSPAKNSSSRVAVPQSLVMVNLILHRPERLEMADTEATVPVPKEGVTATTVEGAMGKISQVTVEFAGGGMFKEKVPVLHTVLLVAMMAVSRLMGS